MERGSHRPPVCWQRRGGARQRDGVRSFRTPAISPSSARVVTSPGLSLFLISDPSNPVPSPPLLPVHCELKVSLSLSSGSQMQCSWSCLLFLSWWCLVKLRYKRTYENPVRGIMRRSILGTVLLILFDLLNHAYTTKAGVTSGFTRSEWPSTDIPLDNEVFAIPKGYNAPQQVHITQGDYDGKAVIISWVTPIEPGSRKVFYGKSKHEYDHHAEGTFTNYTFYNYKSGYIHHCTVDDLEYDTKYYYKVGKDESVREFWFHTPPKVDPNASYTFGIIGDLGQTFNSLSTLEHYMQSGGQAVLFVGDLSYADNYKYDNGIRWDSWGRFIERSVAYQPWIWTVGNHEIEYKPDLGEVTPFKPYQHRYLTPYTASKSSSSLWYAVRRASAHIIVVSSYSPFVKYTPQWQWLKGELQNVDREKTPWLIVLMHAPLYNSNDAHYMEGESMRVAFEKWFVKYKVDLVFAGHVHAYERSVSIPAARLFCI